MSHKDTCLISLCLLLTLSACVGPTPTADLQARQIEGVIESFIIIDPPHPIIKTTDGLRFEVRFVPNVQVFRGDTPATWDDLKCEDRVRITGSVQVVAGEAMPWFIPEKVTILP